MLDICVAAAVAPGATIRVYWGSDSTSLTDWLDVLNGIIANPPTVLSNSWVVSGGDDSNTLGLNGFSTSQIAEYSSKFQALAALGVTVLSACGDDGSRSLTTDGLAHVQYPGSDPWVTSCGGTTVSTSPTAEWVWNDINTNAGFNEPQATGGGVSAFFIPPTYPLPAWQQGVVDQTSINDNTTIGRGVPDVAGNASLNSGYQVSVDGNVEVLCGTSAVAPLYAGLVALITNRLGQKIGFLNPTLYTFRDTVCRDINDQLYPGSPPDNSVPAFTNPNSERSYPAVKGYPSGPGWDACTGLGVIDGGALLAAIQGVSLKDCQFILDRTEIGQAEVAATLTGSTPGIIANAFYVVVDGFSASDLGITASDLSPNNPGVARISRSRGRIRDEHRGHGAPGGGCVVAADAPAVHMGVFGEFRHEPERVQYSSPLPKTVTLQATISGQTGPRDDPARGGGRPVRTRRRNLVAEHRPARLPDEDQRVADGPAGRDAASKLRAVRPSMRRHSSRA